MNADLPPPYETDHRGLHPQDSGYIYRVKFRDRGEKGRQFFKTLSLALARAAYFESQGRWVVVDRYELSNVQRVAELDGRTDQP